MVCDEHAPFFDFEFAIKLKIKDCQDCLAQFLYDVSDSRQEYKRGGQGGEFPLIAYALFVERCT